MKNLLRILSACVIGIPALLLMLVAVSAATTTVYNNDWPGWQAAVGGKYLTEDFNDGVLDPSISVVSDLGAIQGGSGVLGPDNLWWDTLHCPGYDPTTTTWIFANPILAFGAYWDLAGPGGPGASIRMYLNGALVGSEILNTAAGTFWGVVSNIPFDTILLTSGSNCNGAWTETYEMDDMVYSYPLENFVTGGGRIQDGGLFSTFGGVVGFVEGIGIIGNFQFVNHIAKTAWHCNDFEFLYFEGPPATSPVASHNTAVFKGTFRNNVDEFTSTTWIKIVDNGEGKNASAPDQIGFSGDGISWFMYDLRGGNFQVHNVE